VQVSSSQLLEEAVNIAWVYLQRSGELDDGNSAAYFLCERVEALIRRGHRNRMFLANMAIIAYQAAREESSIVPIRQNA
jgi:hypothetical protein